jgi:hypothetical protein
MLGDRAAYQAILEGRGFQAIESLWRAELEDFRRIRMRYLIYDRDSE